jgi:glycosyltransferase involved in cell wall biosynthesis
VALSAFYDLYLVANFTDANREIFAAWPFKEIVHIPVERQIRLAKDIGALYRLTAYFRKRRFNAVHSITPKAGLLTMTAAKLSGIKRRIHIFSGQVWVTRTGFMRKMLIFFDRHIARYTTHILVDGKSQREFLIANHIIPSEKSTVLGNGSFSGIDTKKFKPDTGIALSVRKELNISPDETVFMFLGRLMVDKGILELIDAFLNLYEMYPTIKLILAGNDEGNIEALVKKKVCSKNSIILYGHSDTPERILQACDIFCMPSHREGFGVSVIEASALEKPVICSDIYGLNNAVIENETALKHKVKNTDSLQAQMEKLMNDKALRISLGKNGKEYVTKHFDSETIVKEWVRFYRELFDAS